MCAAAAASSCITDGADRPRSAAFARRIGWRIACNTAAERLDIGVAHRFLRGRYWCVCQASSLGGSWTLPSVNPCCRSRSFGGVEAWKPLAMRGPLMRPEYVYPGRTEGRLLRRNSATLTDAQEMPRDGMASRLGDVRLSAAGKKRAGLKYPASTSAMIPMPRL